VSTRAILANRKAGRSSRQLRPETLEEFLSSEGFILGVLLVVATVIAYYPVYQQPFFNFDDPVYVVNNPHITSGWSWDTISWAFTSFYQFNWHPLTWLSHALDVRLFGIKPTGHHLVNLLLHVANVFLVYLMLLRATGYAGRSAMVAGLFALHPVNVETVAWISERKNLLSMFFFLMGLGAYRWYAFAALQNAMSRPGAIVKRIDTRPATTRYALMTAFFALGLMAKPQIITFPFLLLLWDYWPLGRMAYRDQEALVGSLWPPLPPPRSFWWLVKEKLPLFAICAASAAVTVVAQHAGGAVASLEQYPFPVRLTNAIVAYVRYLGKAVWPSHLAPFYPHPWNALPAWQVVPALCLLIAITALVVLHRERRYLLVGWLWFLGTLVPMLGLMQVGNQAMADRYAYLPFLGLFLMVSWELSELAAAWRVPLLLTRSLAGVVLVALMLANDHQLGYWSNNVALWTHTLEVTDGNYIAHDNLAHAFIDQADPEDALKQFQAALAIYPSDPNALLGIAMYDQQTGNFPDALARYEQMAKVTPEGPPRAELFAKEGLVYLNMKDTSAAQASFAKSVAMDPDSIPGWLGLGVVAEQTGDYQGAVEKYKKANSIQPMKVTYLLMAKALDRAGQPSQAQLARERAKLLPGEDKSKQTFSGGILQP